MKYRDAEPYLKKSLASLVPEVRANAARALGDMQAKSAAGDLVKMLATETSGGVIQQTSLSLRKLKHATAVPALKRVATHEDHQTRVWVIQAISELGEKTEVPKLIVIGCLNGVHGCTHCQFTATRLRRSLNSQPHPNPRRRKSPKDVFWHSRSWRRLAAP